MRHGLKLRNYKISKLPNRVHPQRGYILITLMLAMALVTIALLAVLPEIQQQIRRDREEEMRHRGTEYMRAIQHFYKKFQRYPTRIEELENTNNLRFLRKRYTDPMSVDPATGKEKDFKLMHQQDLTLNQGSLQAPNPNQPGGNLQNPPLGGPTLPQGGPQAGPQNPPPAASGDSSNAQETEGNSNSAPSGPGSLSGPGSGSGFGGQTFGGGPILGVVSTNKKDKSIRVFNDKNHYNDWLFVYLPQADRGGLLMGPVSLNGTTGGMPGLNPGQIPGQFPGQQPGQQPGGFGLGQTPNGGPFQNNPGQPPQNPNQQQ